MPTFGERIKDLRIKINISQKELADNLGYKTFTTVSKWESDASLPPGKELVKIATYFNVSTDYLLGLNNEAIHYRVDDFQNTVDLDYFEAIQDYFSHLSKDQVDTSHPKIKVPNNVLTQSPENYFVTKVRTDSMNRRINNGDYIVTLDIHEMNLSDLSTGDIVIAKIDGEYKMEILRKTDTTIYLEPDSYLDGFDTLVFSLEEFKKVELLGKVVYSFRHFDASFQTDRIF